MPRIEKLVIDGYRGIDHFEYEPNMINILVGRNNTGKSSILEATAITYTAPTGFLDKMRNNILIKIIERKGWENLEFFINLNKKDKESKMTAIKNGKEASVSAYYRIGIYEEIPKDAIDLISRYYSNLYREQKIFLRLTGRSLKSIDKSIEDRIKEKISEALKVPLLFGQVTPGSNYFIALPNERKVLTTVSDPSDIIFVSIEKFNIKHLYDMLLPTVRIHQTLDYIRHHIPYFNDLRSDGQKMWIYFENLPKPLPLSMIGDGMRETIRLLFVASLIPGGVLLLEEPENNLHPGLYDVVAERLVDIVRNDETQVFLSTHNLEFADKLLRYGGELVNVVRLYRVKDEFAYEVLRHDEALEELDELHIDLRGP